MAEVPLRFRAPGSKSLTQRALILAALASGESELASALDSDDTLHLRTALRGLGVAIDDTLPDRWRVNGGALRPPAAPLWCGDGGTVVRFLAPFALLLDAELVLDGSSRLAERPLGALLDALRHLGVSSRPLAPPRGLPVALRRSDAARHEVQVDASVSSQFLSGLLMVAPCVPGGLSLGVGATVSRPYIDMTLEAMRERGACVVAQENRFLVEPGGYRAGPFEIEGDWSAAAFLLAGSFVAQRPVVVENIRAQSLQGDRAIAGFLEELERPRPHRFDLTSCPDLLPPLAAAAAFASHPSEISGVAHARVKESDRVSTLAQGFAVAGVQIEERTDGLLITPG
ncbi:MAG: 3-phosphoshikimate 1-carboxyvinyltransferase, partial [Deltaproteobacteria bacterium]|nr:3-phosphoshikimate 1-carboxyvinyltransferase [Deltaproteobacteria bacterium]